MKQEYSEYSSIDINTIDSNIANKNILLKSDIDNFKSDVLIHSLNFIYECMQLSFNYDKSELISKYSLFSPQMLSLIINSNYKTMLEHMSGIGTLSEIVKSYNPKIDITFNSVNDNINNFAKWRFQKNKINISLSKNISDQYDIIVSDGFAQYLSKENQSLLINNLFNMLNPNGLLCLLIDLSGKGENPLVNDVDIIELHSILENSDMVCIFGKNTFSSLWKKMI